MKLRIHGNSVRLRLTRSEVERFARDGKIESVVGFGPAPYHRLTYGFAIRPQSECMAVEYSSNCITIFVSPLVAQDWTTTERISVSDHQPLGNEGCLEILVEKEFRRMRDAVPDPDLYPNPLQNKRPPESQA